MDLKHRIREFDLNAQEREEKNSIKKLECSNIERRERLGRQNMGMTESRD